MNAPGGPQRVILARHGLSEYNVLGILNGDPTVPVNLTDEGLEQCRRLGAAIADEPIDLAVCTRLPRTRRTVEIALEGRDVPVHVISEFDDVRLGVFEGRQVGEFRSWRREHGPDARPPGGGESRVDALRRYAAGYEALLQLTATCVLCVVHDITIRMMVNAANGDDPVSGPVTHVPNAIPHVFDADQLRAGLARMRSRAEP